MLARVGARTSVPVTTTRHGVKASVTGVQVIRVTNPVPACCPGWPGTGSSTARSV